MFLFVVTEAGEKSAAVTNVPAEGSREKAEMSDSPSMS